MKISNQIIENHGLKLDEYKKIQNYLKRSKFTWTGYFSAMNEHCSYKSSKIHLKKLLPKVNKLYKDLVRMLEW